MPLTPAEKMKRYREKLKNDPDRYEEYKQKDLNRIKIKNKKNIELSETEKQDQRKKWREQKKRQKEKKTMSEKKETEKNKPTTGTETNRNKCTNKNHILTIRRLRRMYESAVNKNKMLHNTIEKIRKKLYRIRVKSSKEIDRLNDKITKMKAREEVIECALRSVYNTSKGQAEKRLMKRVADTDIVKKNKCKTYVAKLLGLQGRIRIVVQQARKMKSDKIKAELTSFFIRDDISRSTSGKKECKTVHKEKNQIRYLTDKLFNLYQIYKEEGGRHSFTTFFRYKPAYVLSPNIHNRNTCLCIKHSNMDMLFSSLLKNGAFPSDVKSLTDIISKSSCDSNSYNCMHGKCTICKQSKLIYALEEEALSKKVYWEQWERVDHTYEKIEKEELKQIRTKKTVKNRKHNTIADLLQIFVRNLPPYKIHIHNWKHQQRKYREKIEKMGPSEALILCDFSENYECKSSEEVQAIHFGASKNQITLHCGMIYWASGSQSFCSVSDSKCHEPGAIWAHLLPVIELLRTERPETKFIHFFSDGPSSQYRQKKNFHLLNFYTTELGLDFCTWNFSESGHGKGVADGIGGSVKRTLDKQVAYGRDITNGKQAFEILKSVSKTIKFFFIEDPEIQKIQNSLPVAIKAVPGTLQIHQVMCFANSSRLLHRVLSCFCQTEKDHVCECFDLKEHPLQKCTFDKRSNDIFLPSTSKTGTDTMDSSLVGLPQNPEGLDLFEDGHDLNADTFAELFETDASNLPILLLSESSTTRLASSDKELSCYDLNTAENYGQENTLTDTFTESTNLPNLLLTESSATRPASSDKELSCYDLTTAGNYGRNNTSTDTFTESTLPKLKQETYSLRSRNDRRILCDNMMAHKRLVSTLSTKNQIEISHIKRSRFTTADIKKNHQNKNPSIRTLISRNIQCYACKKKVAFMSVDLTAKCLSCKNWFCATCSEGNNNIDFICRKCFGEEYL